jgi:anti-sigma factor (TIGR02949 family)
MTARPLSLFDCESIVRRLWPFLDGTLAESDRATIVEHLVGCGNCRSHFDFAQAFLDAVHELRPEETADEQLRSRVLAALKEDGFSGDPISRI